MRFISLFTPSPHEAQHSWQLSDKYFSGSSPIIACICEPVTVKLDLKLVPFYNYSIWMFMSHEHAAAWAVSSHRAVSVWVLMGENGKSFTSESVHTSACEMYWSIECRFMDFKVQPTSIINGYSPGHLWCYCNAGKKCRKLFDVLRKIRCKKR